MNLFVRDELHQPFVISFGGETRSCFPVNDQVDVDSKRLCQLTHGQTETSAQLRYVDCRHVSLYRETGHRLNPDELIRCFFRQRSARLADKRE